MILYPILYGNFAMLKRNTEQGVYFDRKIYQPSGPEFDLLLSL